MTEIWKPIEGYTGYEVSNFGNVRSFKRTSTGELMKQHTRENKRGRKYKYVTLCGGKRGLQKKHPVHLLVLTHFVGPRPEGCVGRHKDDDVNNNRLDNLCWGTHKENARDAINNGVAACISMRKLTDEQVRYIRTSSLSNRALAERFSVGATTICYVKQNKIYQHC